MIPTAINVRSTSKLNRRAFQETSKEAWGDAADFWHARLLPEKFKVVAVSRYGFQQRAKGYMIAKARAKGHQKPLVWSGETQRQVLRKRDVRTVRARGASSGAAVVKLTVPGYVTRPWKNRPNMQAELAVLDDRDARALGEVIRETVARSLNEGETSRPVG